MNEGMIKGLSEKIYLEVAPPTEEDNVSDAKRMASALTAMGYAGVRFTRKALKDMYPTLRDSQGRITLSAVHTATGTSVTSVEAGDKVSRHTGLAVDLGSTNVDGRLVDMTDGSVMASAKRANAQIAFGKDILTRITYTLEKGEEGMEELRRATLETIDSLIGELSETAGTDAKGSPAMVISGNTTMIHFLLGLSAWSVFSSPYAPVVTSPGLFYGRELGLDYDGYVYIVPSASNYIGGDIISGLSTIDMGNGDSPSMFFDIGTNGELVLGSRDGLIAGAGAAGPALEGDISRYAMRAGDGAVNRVTIKGRRLTVKTIGDAVPKGICGTGIIDLLAQMRLAGWMDVAGRLVPEASDDIIYLEDESQYAAVYARTEDGSPLFFTQEDIDQYMDTKAAAFTMIECLLREAGCEAKDLDKFYLAGAIASNSDLENVITLGMLPDIDRGKYVCLGNSSLSGAQAILTDRSLIPEAERLAEDIWCVQLAGFADFLVVMQAAKFVPHTDMERFPSVKAALEKNGVK